MISNRADVERFLSDVRQQLKDGNFSNHEKVWRFRETLSWLGGWMPQDAYDFIALLSFKEYKEGPEIDENDPLSDKYWMFKPSINSDDLYIKLKICYQTDSKLIIKSFHIDGL